MLAVTVYSVFVKTWGKGTVRKMKRVRNDFQDENHIHMQETDVPLWFALLGKTLSVYLQNMVSNFGVGIALSLESHY
jgi:phosphoribosylaminoimidazole (AIR) synthetase